MRSSKNKVQKTEKKILELFIKYYKNLTNLKKDHFYCLREIFWANRTFKTIGTTYFKLVRSSKLNKFQRVTPSVNSVGLMKIKNNKISFFKFIHEISTCEKMFRDSFVNWLVRYWRFAFKLVVWFSILKQKASSKASLETKSFF